MAKIKFKCVAFIIFNNFLQIFAFQDVTETQLNSSYKGIIDINTNKTTKVFTLLDPLFLVGGLNEKVLIKNTGKSLEITLDQQDTVTTITGGLLKDKLYIYKKCRFYWSDDIPNGVAGTTINGKEGSLLEVVLYYYNDEYESFEDALNKVGGVVQVSVRIDVKGLLPNPLFDPFESSVKKVLYAGNQERVTVVIVFIWYALFLPTSEYWAYQTSYIDEITGKEYFGSTMIVTPLSSLHFISIPQFKDTFGSLLDFSNNSLTNVAKQFPTNGRLVQDTFGALEAFGLSP